MIHLGDITKVNGAEIDPVDVIIGGSPCQDLSVAGKRAGLEGKRSGLFMDQIRIIKECRDATRRTNDTVRPRFMVWENVPGAFSSAGGEDFRAVLEETARVADETVSIPRPAGGKWTNAGAIMGNGWSIAWRTMDAQYWGVPQRRRRIALVADFGGETATEILFERTSVQGDSAESGGAWQRTAEGAERCVGEAIGVDGYNQSMTGNVSKTLNSSAMDYHHIPLCFENHSQDSRYKGPLDVCPMLPAQHGTGGNNTPFIAEPAFFQNTGQGWWNESNVGATVRTPCGGDSTKANLVAEPVAYGIGNGQVNQVLDKEKAAALNCMHDQQAVMTGYTARRLTPLECERLQGFPDGWTDIPDYIDNGKKKSASDSARYKALGNSIALPPWHWICQRIRAQYDRPITLGSLFDGIGGFPLIWESINGKGSARWASEIEPFPIAVTKYHFKEEV